MGHCDACGRAEALRESSQYSRDRLSDLCGGSPAYVPCGKAYRGSYVMQLPPQLSHAIALETAQHNLRSLTQAATELSAHYRSQRSASGMCKATAAHRLAYAAVRMPATFAAARAVFTEMRRLMPDRCITSLL